MGYWGWRPLLIAAFISVWITGCSLAVQPAQTIAPAPTPTSAVTLTVGRIGPPTPDSSISAARTRPAATRTAAPTPEPTPTPTPQIYIVQPGDTLLDIALRYGIELADLRAANAESDLSLLQIGQRLIIPPPAPADAGGPPPEPVDILALAVGPPECYQTRINSIICLGRIDNPTDSAAEGVSVAVRLVQLDGGIAAQDTGAVEQTLIPPRGFAPYRAQFDLSWARFQSEGLQPSAELLSASAAALVEARYAVPVLREVVTRAEEGRFSLSGVVVNGETGPVTGVRIVVTLLDDADRVIGYRVAAFSERVFAPGEATPVYVEVVPAAPAAIAGYHVYAEARRM
ncbi:MAG: LysM peptidoglycan-binding domain-containing protein [Candidatus Flexifilum sp.]|jgi:LysM repeat protein